MSDVSMGNDDLGRVGAPAEEIANGPDVERARREAEARWKAIFENAPDMVFELDRHGTIRFINRVVPPLERSQAEGTHWLDWVPADERPRLQAKFDRVIRSAEAASYEVLARHVDGAMTSYSCHLGPIVENGTVTGVVLIARDDTEQKTAEAQLFAADRMISMGTLAAGVAHEINNPLAALVANVEVAERVLSSLPAEARAPIGELLADIAEAARRVRGIVRDLKLLARPEDEMGAVDLGAVIDWSIRMTWFELRHRATLARDYVGLPLAVGNDGRLGQVFVNLLINAAQAIEEGQPEDHRVTVRGRADERYVYVDVEDTGVGMSDELVARLFSPFVSTKPAGIGTGLGLSISRRIVASFGGEIRVRSAPGKGSTFTVSLPRAEALQKAGNPAAIVTPARPATRRGRVLVIDDEPMIGLAIQRILERFHDVDVVTTGGEGLLRLASGECFDVVFCDLMMPHTTGMDVHREIAKVRPDVARDMIFLTGGAFSSSARAFIERVPNLRIDKPFDAERLTEVVNERVVMRDASPAASGATQRESATGEG